MKKKLSLGNGILLAAPLVASLNLGVSPSSAAILAGNGMDSANSQEIIDRLEVLDLDVANIDAANTDRSDRDVLVMEDLLSILSRDSNKKPQPTNDLKSFWGNLSAGINDIFASGSETEFTAVAPVNVPINNVRSSLSSIQAINSFPADRERDPLRVVLKSLIFSGSPTNREQNQPLSTTYTGKAEPAEINPSPVSGDNPSAASPESKPATVETYTTAASSQVVETKTTPKLAQLPSALQGDRENLDLMQIAGGVLALGFFVWMLFQD